MPENGMPGPACDLSSVRESVCIHTRKIFDSCRDKDCVEDLRFYRRLWSCCPDARWFGAARRSCCTFTPMWSR